MSVGPCSADLLTPERREEKVQKTSGRGGKGRVRHASGPTTGTGPLTPLQPHFCLTKSEEARLQGFHENKKYRSLSSSPAPPRTTLPREGAPF